MVNSVLMGGTAGLAVQAGAGAVAASAPAGVITSGGALLAHFARQRATWRPPRDSRSPHPGRPVGKHYTLADPNEIVRIGAVGPSGEPPIPTVSLRRTPVSARRKM